MLTAMKQEVTRKHKAEKWALDDVVYHTEVTSYERMEQASRAVAVLSVYARVVQRTCGCSYRSRSSGEPVESTRRDWKCGKK